MSETPSRWTTDDTSRWRYGMLTGVTVTLLTFMSLSVIEVLREWPRS
jgi:hypothetical protein